MYIDVIEFGFVFFIAVIAVVAIAIVAARHIELAKWAALIVATVAVFMAAFAFLPPAFADEYRRLEVIDFNFETAEVILMDEDGYTWLCPFGEHSWELGEEYTLFIPNEGEPEIYN